MKHIHVVGTIEYRCKPDSVYISCLRCSHIECIGTWYFKPPEGWSKRQWPKLKQAICLYLNSMDDFYRVSNKNE
jgi:hypothetical protein